MPGSQATVSCRKLDGWGGGERFSDLPIYSIAPLPSEGFFEFRMVVQIRIPVPTVRYLPAYEANIQHKNIIQQRHHDL